ncbi:PP2C family serine/threonine-protein phosphatase [Sulfurimonas sp.]|uniref:PP2C family protein-serine/threonine phosphatase n=1 Tax=Sulfurimonas sp. TaxID=2022749 RepID=UPI002B470715|nr:PP2C family serine/threonine-protein phosphatase [Sulfurimonas sp.]
MQCISCSFTHPGHIRMNNEDAYFTNNESELWIVCDGMGGHQEGNFASHLVTDIFEHVKLNGSLDQKIEAISSQFYNIHRILQKKVHKLGNDAVIGTTLVLLLIEGDQAVSIHSGDSRCYIVRDNTLSLVTQDHARSINHGEGERKALTKALCAPGELSLEVKKFKIQRDDIFLLCSDGFYDNLSTSIIKEGMQINPLESAMDYMSSKVLEGTADDNLTATLVSVQSV